MSTPDDAAPAPYHHGMRAVLLAVGLTLLFCALFVRSYTVPPAPDRRGGTRVFLSLPNRPILGSPRADCIAPSETGLAIVCLVASVNRAQDAGIPLTTLPFCAACYAWSERIALLGQDGEAAARRRAEIARFGW